MFSYRAKKEKIQVPETKAAEMILLLPFSPAKKKTSKILSRLNSCGNVKRCSSGYTGDKKKP